MTEIEIEDLGWIARDHAGIEHHIGDGAVAVAGGLLRSEHRFVDGEPPAGKPGEELDHGVDAFIQRITLHQLGDRDGAGIDHGIEGPVGHLVEHDGIERFAGGLDAHMAEHGIAPEMLQRIAIHEGLRYRLDGEDVVGVAGGIDLAIDGGERNAEQRRIGLAELGDIVGDLAAGCLPDALMQLGQEIVHRSKSNHALGSRHAQCAARLVHLPPEVRPSPSPTRTLAINHALSKA